MKLLIAVSTLLLTGSGFAIAQNTRLLSPPLTDTGRKAGDSTPGTLQTAVVKHRLPLMEQKIDRIIVNVGSLPSHAGASILDVLSTTPGLEADDDGNVSLKGRSGTQIWVDGKPTNLSGSNLAAFLRALPAGSVTRIELMSIPPAGYAAAGSGGIINIITRKDKTPGWTGTASANLTQGRYERSTDNLFLHFQRDRWTFNFNSAYTLQNSYYQSDRSRIYSLPDGSPNGSLQQHNYESSHQTSYYNKLTVDYTLPPSKTEWELMTEVYYGPYREWGNYQFHYFDAADHLDSLLLVNSQFSNAQLTRHIDLSLRQPLKKGALLTAEGGIVWERLDQAQRLLTTAYTPQNTPLDRDDFYPGQPWQSTVSSGQVDYSQPLGKGQDLSAGWESDLTHLTNRNTFTDTAYQAPYPGTAPEDSSWSSGFLYQEAIHALYISYKRERRQWSVQAGLRGEYTRFHGQVPGTRVENDSSFTRSYTSLFPSLHLSYQPDSGSDHQFLLAASRRIDRPGYWQLNPASFYYDRSTIRTGNPYLLPAYSYEGELSYVYKQHINTSLSYSDERNTTMTIVRQEGTVFLSSPANIGHIQSFEWNAGATLTFAKQWTTVLYNEWSYNWYKLSQPGVSDSLLLTEAGAINPNGRIYRASVSQQWRPDDYWNMEVSAFYKSGTRTVQAIYQPLWFMNAAIQRKLLGERLTLSLAAKDIFHTRIYRFQFNTLPGQRVYYTNIQDSRLLSLTASWRFGKQTGRQKPGAQSEIDRLKNN